MNNEIFLACVRIEHRKLTISLGDKIEGEKERELPANANDICVV